MKAFKDLQKGDKIYTFVQDEIGIENVVNVGKESKKRYSINITAYYLWEDFYKKLINDLKIDFNIHKVKNSNVIRIGTGKQTNIKKIFEFVNKNNLLYLERKWKKIVY